MSQINLAMYLNPKAMEQLFAWRANVVSILFRRETCMQVPK